MKALIAAVAALGLTARFAGADETSREIIEKAVKAAGGMEKLSAVRNLRFKAKGTVMLPVPDPNGAVQQKPFGFKGDFSLQLPDKSREEIEMDLMGQKFTMLQVLLGDGGFIIGGGEDRKLEGDRLAESKESVHSSRVQLLAPLLNDKEFELTSLGDTKVGTAATVAVRVAAKGRKEILLHFDKTTFLLLKLERDALDGDGKKIRNEEIYSAYKDFGGIQFATKILVKHDGKKFMEGEATDVEFPAKFDDKHFAKPE